MRGNGLRRAAGLVALALLAHLMATGAARAADDRLSQFTLASQHDWGAKRGFYLIIDNHTSGDTPASLQAATLTLAIGDGTAWHSVKYEQLAQGRTYHVRALIDANQATLFVNNEPVGKIDAAISVPEHENLYANVQQPWANGAADYDIAQTQLIVNNGAWSVNQRWPQPSDAQRAMRSSFKFTDDRAVAVPLTVTATFVPLAPVDLRTVGPLVDGYGQATFADWPGKVTSVDDLKAATRDEDARLSSWGEPANRDGYGGVTNMGWRERGTGYYRVVQRGGVWWLISPHGNPMFYTGICTAPAQDWDATPLTGREMLFANLPDRTGAGAGAYRGPAWGETRGEYLAIQAANMQKKYGDGWQQTAADLTLRRMRVWGFSGLGKWVGMRDVPVIVVLGRGGIANLGRHPDTFDPATRERFRQHLEDQIRPRLNDPYVVGWSVGNEYDECFTDQEVKDILARHDAAPGKKALVDQAIALHDGVETLARAWGVNAGSKAALYTTGLTPAPEDIEPLRQFLARDYYKFLYETIKKIDPNHLYISGWVVPGWWQNQSDWTMQAEFCDVLGYDQYSRTFGAAPATELIAQTDKPILVGEFGFPADYDGTRGFGRYGTAVPDDASSGAAYARYVEAAAKTPNCIGAVWFQYRDQPITGRGPVREGLHAVEGENYAFGLVDVTDRPKWPLVERVRETNLRVTQLHDAVR